MNHYINLLEESEKRFFSAAETSPLLKIGAVAGVALALGLVYFMVSSMTSTIREADQLTRRWDQIKDDVSAARERATALRRIEDSHNTLLGWSPSRHNWADALQRIQDELPEPRTRFQFTRLHFDEEIVGLRRHRPGVDDLAHPWTREARGELRGLITGFGAESAYAEIERNLVRAENGTPPLFSSALLENSTLQAGTANREAPLFLFNFSMNLSPRRIVPGEDRP
ncbi:MAG: hypothetical protein JJU05_09595 [Verrucomicrobia bacterium]|nr:hypothetical protein [Verrucomicrobiota bacterium]MCH8525996.1 hypothetical protein [Kiritimatiellia bacterium]